MMSIQEKLKENSSNVIKKSEDKNLGTQIQGSLKNPAKKSGPKETTKSLVKSSSESKINQPELGTYMSTRSAKAVSNDKKASKSISKNMVILKGQSQQESTKKKKLCQKNSVHEIPKSNEQLNRRSQRLQQLTEVSTRTLRSREIQGLVQVVKQNLPPTRKERSSNTQNKSNKVKTSQKHVKRKVLEIKSDSKGDENPVVNEVTNSPKGKKRKVEQQIAYTCSSQCIKGSEKCLQKNVRKEETRTVPVTSSEIRRSKMTTSVVSKKNEIKKSVHTQVNSSVKSQKSPKPSVPEQSVDDELEQTGKSKRGSILQLCEEIAGEIESDTVEVKKESSQMENVKEEKLTEVKLEKTEVEKQIIQKETTQDVQCNRFFPSRKTKPVKCILNGINSSAKKNSNWTKIKLSKFNSVQQNKLDSQASPKLGLLQTSFSLPALEMHHHQSSLLDIKSPDDKGIACQKKEMKEVNSEVRINNIKVEFRKNTKVASENCQVDNQTKPSIPPLGNQMKHSLELTSDKNVSLCLQSKIENNPVENTVSTFVSQAKLDTGESKFAGSAPKQQCSDNKTSKSSDNRETSDYWPKCNSHLEITIPKDLKLKETEKVDEKQLIIDAGQKRFGAVSCNVCGMLYTASNPEDETQHLLFHNQFISAVKYVGWKKERILAEYPDGRIIMVLPEDPKYALKKVDEIREMVDNDLGFQQAPLMCYSRTKTLLFISNDKKVVGCLIAEHIQWGYRVIEEKLPVIRSEEEKVRFERQKAWCCSTSPEPAICGISRIWVFSMMRRKKIASRMIECLRSNFIYGSYLSKEEIAFSDPTPDGKLFATQYCGTGQFLVYNFINGQNST
ncbi:PREDICTED: N-acetyltransferase ESCO1 isoform X2 [Condylura cristata]|uniref:N-acetyltransferase ESCO1 isoform X2 n=1 Tax=Condylura cristata TaxID=143302 RepID=UPI000334399A|nr:PREDICTED: N-acetyltransferase ESCO1 isoform X2 [Condylura cristata]